MSKKTIGDFELVRHVGKGSLGDLYMAQHRFIKKNFALKLLPTDITQDPEWVARFEKEVPKIAEVDHPHIVKVHTISAFQDQYFLVYDWIGETSGESIHLGQYLSMQKRRLDEEEIVHLLKQVAHALDDLHGYHVRKEPLFHHSLKLSNILVKIGEDRKPYLFLSDAHLAVIVGAGNLLNRFYHHLVTELCEGERARVAMHWQVAQNYSFFAPEQKMPLFDKLADHKADIYAFGVLAYFLLVGQMPMGAFKMPSGLKYHWESLIASCMHPDSAMRPNTLTDLLTSITESITPVELVQVEPKIEKVQTMKVVRPVEQSLYDIARKEAEPLVREKITPPPVKEETMFTQRKSVEQSLYGGMRAQVSQKSSVAVQEVESPPVQEPLVVRPSPTLVAMQRVESTRVSQYTDFERRLTGESAERQPLLNPSEFKRCEYEDDPGKVFQGDTIVARYTPEKKLVENVEPLLCDMVIVAGGEYTRGSNESSRDERPEHKIYLDTFALDIHPVTNEQFSRFLQIMEGEKDANNNDIIHLKESRIKRYGGKLTIESGYAKHPVVGVTWYGAVAYAKWVGKRLPTEAEWEIASAGGHDRLLYPSGENIERSQANFFSADTTAVMSYPSNPLGLFDMAGNVYEWCHDWYDYNYYGACQQEPDNPQGPQQGVYRVLRGGCWKSLKDDLRCSHRHRNNPGTVNRTYGFRCAADVQ